MGNPFPVPVLPDFCYTIQEMGKHVQLGLCVISVSDFRAGIIVPAPWMAQGARELPIFLLESDRPSWAHPQLPCASCEDDSAPELNRTRG